jgi:type II secretory pathway pseudopilin PulG
MNTIIKRSVASKKGLTLIEIIISFALIFIIIIGFMSTFVYSAKVNRMSKTSVNSTYIARDNIEMVYSLSKTLNFEAGINSIETEKGYTSIPGVEKLYGKVVNGKYVTIKLTESGNLIKVLVNVYKDDTLTNLESKMETILSWMQ